jgi:hypothetical protein
MKKTLALIAVVISSLTLAGSVAVADTCACGNGGYIGRWYTDHGNPYVGGHYDCLWPDGSVTHGC